jgi:hypothetical protein
LEARKSGDEAAQGEVGDLEKFGRGTVKRVISGNCLALAIHRRRGDGRLDFEAIHKARRGGDSSCAVAVSPSGCWNEKLASSIRHVARSFHPCHLFPQPRSEVRSPPLHIAISTWRLELLCVR